MIFKHLNHQAIATMLKKWENGISNVVVENYSWLIVCTKYWLRLYNNSENEKKIGKLTTA